MAEGIRQVSAWWIRCFVVVGAFVLAMVGNLQAQASDAACHELVRSPRVGGLVQQDLGAVTVGVPSNWLNRGPECPAGIYMDAEALDSLRALDELGEWDAEYEAIVEAVMVGAEPVAHFGAEPWAGSFYSDLQVRVYRSSLRVGEVERQVRGEGRRAAVRVTDGEVRITEATFGRWTRQSIRFSLWFWDYGATALVDFVSAWCASATVTLVFMHVDARTDSEWNHEPLIEEIVESIECRV